MIDLVNITIPNAALTALLGYLVVFLGLVLLMVVIIIQGKIMAPKKAAQAENAAPVSAEPAAETKQALPKAPGTAGELKLYDTDPRDAAMIMAIVADSTGKPLNELRFLSIREIKEEEKQ